MHMPQPASLSGAAVPGAGIGVVSEPALGFGIWPHPACLATSAQMNTVKESTVSHLGGETDDWQKREQAGKGEEGQGAVIPNLPKMSPSCHHTM